MTALNSIAKEAIALIDAELEKKGFVPAGPMDPAMAGGAPPMDPAMMGGAPPMDPAMMGGAPPMDPAMLAAMGAGGAAGPLGAPPPPPAPAAPPAEAAPAAPAEGNGGAAPKPAKPDAAALDARMTSIEQTVNSISTTLNQLVGMLSAVTGQPVEQQPAGPEAGAEAGAEAGGPMGGVPELPPLGGAPEGGMQATPMPPPEVGMGAGMPPGMTVSASDHLPLPAAPSKPELPAVNPMTAITRMIRTG